MSRKKLKKGLCKYTRLLLPRTSTNLAIFDDIFPYPQSAFRLVEYNAYLTHFPTARAYSTGETLPALSKTAKFEDVLVNYGREFPQFQRRVESFPGWRSVSPQVAYCIFVNNARWVLPLAEEAGAGFVFTL